MTEKNQRGQCRTANSSHPAKLVVCFLRTAGYHDNRHFFHNDPWMWLSNFWRQFKETHFRSWDVTHLVESAYHVWNLGFVSHSVLHKQGLHKVTFHGLERLYLCVCVYMHACNNNWWKRKEGFEREQRGVYEKGQRGERDGIKAVIKI